MEHVVFVHGLWMLGPDMAILRKRVRQCGFKVHQFSYPTVRKSPQESAIQLHAYIKKLNVAPLHFVAHSLGGLVVRHLFHLYPEQRSGNVLTLGTPHAGSEVAAQLSHSAWGRLILGKSVQQGLLGDVPEWRASNPLGVIAGAGSVGIGRLLAHFSEENDGTIAVSETKLKGSVAHLTMPCSHIGLIYNKAVAEQVCTFLKQGHFTN
ncbi:hypothetical protein MNBD_GAMMA23-2173 [hydrothermal vent metagenome]|uniref:DUF676 domain-containing protein n=1 Tax=hydrothermal vent metagenome TaxID=652676 RepID=A0A3B1A7B7_9ZZZZ